jgi:hypothetical protein
MTNQQHMQISIDGSAYSVPLSPFDPSDMARDLSFRPGSGPAKWRLPIFANGVWYSVPLWEDK